MSNAPITYAPPIPPPRPISHGRRALVNAKTESLDQRLQRYLMQADNLSLLLQCYIYGVVNCDSATSIPFSSTTGSATISYFSIRLTTISSEVRRP